MAVAFRASSTQVGDVSAGANGTVTITKPTVVAGDVLIATFCINESTTAGTLATPTGWTLIGAAIASTKVRVYAFWALQSVAGLAFTFTASVGAGSISWTCLSFSGVDNTTPIDATGTGNSQTGSATVSVATFNTATDQALEVFTIGDWNAGSTFSNASFNFVLTSNSANCQQATAYANAATTPAGATGAFTITDGGSATGQILCYQQFALRPAAAAGLPPARTVYLNQSVMAAAL